MYKRMPEEMADKYRDLHSVNVVQYVLGLDELPTEEEFVKNYANLTSSKAGPSQKRYKARREYRFLKENGLL